MANEEQAAIWDDQVGDAWVDNAVTYDEMLTPFGEAVMDRLELRTGQSVLDVGCGTGATTVEIAKRVAPGRVVGVDLSSRMLAAARDRARKATTPDATAAAGAATGPAAPTAGATTARATTAGATTTGAADAADISFTQADVQTADLGRDTFDRAFSRMGVMFFADPVAAFANVAGALRPGGRFGFCCFQGLDANPGIVLPLLSVAEILQLPPPPDPLAPGPFSLADPSRIAGLLERAGFVGVTVEAGPDRVRLSGADDLHGLAERLLVQNPMTNTGFAEADATTRAATLEAAATALAPLCDGDTMEMTVGTWIVTAHTPD